MNYKELEESMNQMKTATEILNKPIEVRCYLCGKGKIIVRQGDISLSIPDSLDWRTRNELREYLTENIKLFFKNL